MRPEKISFVIPCYRSEESIGLVVEDIYKAFDTDEYNYEIVLVNDSSPDGTWSEIKKLTEKYTNIIGINLGKNSGQDAALLAGYAHATGDIIVSLDDDGQNPPEEAHKLIKKLSEGFDVVFGKYHEKKDTKFKTWGSRFNDKMACAMIGKPKDLSLCSYFVMNRFVVNEILKYDGAYPYVWWVVLRTTDKIANEYIEHKSREIGQSTYTLNKLVSYWFNGFLSFSVKPLRVATVVGSGTAIAGFIYLIVVLIQWLIDRGNVEGWTSIIAITLILGGIQLLTVGVVGEYVGRTYITVNNAPLYTVHDVISRQNTDYK